MNLTDPSFNRDMRSSRGFTLVELVLSLGIMSMLLVGIASSMIIASRAIPVPNSPAALQGQAFTALDQLRADISCATSVTALTTTAITVTVADRGHGAAGEETIRWSWSGTSGAPLTRSYNGSPPATLASNVTSFAITPTYVAGVLTAAPRVLMITDRRPSLWDPEETTQVAKLTKWEFPVVTLRSDATAAQFNAAAANADVVFVTLYATDSAVTPMLRSTSCGVVVECSTQTTGLGVVSNQSNGNGTGIGAIDPTHVITAGLNPLGVTLTTQSNPLSVYSGLAPRARLLSYLPATFCVLDVGESLLGGGTAQGRRVLLPWGGTSFDNQELNSNGWTIVKRSLVWAASPSRYGAMDIKLTVGSGAESSTDVELFSQPRVPR